MALTFGSEIKYDLGASQDANLRHTIVDVTFDSSYPTGGESLIPADVKLATIEYLEATQKGVGNRIAEFDYVNSKLKLYTALGTEAANLSDQSTIVVRVLAVGRKPV